MEMSEKIKGANWFRTIASLSLINIVASLLNIRFIFGLGSTELFQAAITNSQINPLLGGLCIIVLPVFFFWTWWLSAMKGDKLAYIIGWIIYLIDSLLLLYLFLQNEEASSVMVDFVLHIVVLLFCFNILGAFSKSGSSEERSTYTCYEDYINDNGASKLGIHKIGYIVGAIITAVISVYSVFCVTSEPKLTQKNIAEYIHAINKDLPKDIEGEDIVFQQVESNGDSVEYIYQVNNFYLSESDTDYLAEFALVRKHEMLYSMSVDPNMDNFVTTCLAQGFTFVFRFNDATSEKLYEIVITPEEYHSIVSNGKHLCPDGKIKDLINKYTAKLPIDYLGGMTLNNISLSSDNTSIIYDVKLPQMTADDFVTVTPSYLNEYIKSNFKDMSDLIMRLAMVNQMTICFDISTASGVKYTKVNITPDKYNKN